MSEEEKYELAKMLRQWFERYDSLEPTEADGAVLDVAMDVVGEFGGVE